MRNILVTLCLIFTVASLQAKPLSSLSINIDWKDPLITDQVSQLHVKIVSNVDTAALQFKLLLPEGVSLQQGQQQQLLTVRKNVPYEFDLPLLVTQGSTGEIKVEASIGSPGSTYFFATDIVVLESNSQTLKARQLPSGRYREVERNGDRIREYSLD